MGLGDIINTDNYPLMKPPVNIEEILNFPDEDELAPTPEPEPFPTVPILVTSAMIVVIVAAGLLVYFKKRCH
jgi:hypothetical protein